MQKRHHSPCLGRLRAPVRAFLMRALRTAVRCLERLGTCWLLDFPVLLLLKKVSPRSLFGFSLTLSGVLKSQDIAISRGSPSAMGNQLLVVISADLSLSAPTTFTLYTSQHQKEKKTRFSFHLRYIMPKMDAISECYRLLSFLIHSTYHFRRHRLLLPRAFTSECMDRTQHLTCSRARSRSRYFRSSFPARGGRRLRT